MEWTRRAQTFSIVGLIVVACVGFRMGYSSVELPELWALYQGENRTAILLERFVVGVEWAALYTSVVGGLLLVLFALDWILEQARASGP